MSSANFTLSVLRVVLAAAYVAVPTARVLAQACDHISPPPVTDVPDDAFIDSNGDGIDGMRCGPIFVATTGLDSNPGTIDAPMRTLNAAILAAKLHSPVRDVYVGAGMFSGRVLLAEGVNIYGGFDPANNWSRGNANVTQVTGDQFVVVGRTIAVPTTIDRIRVSNAGVGLGPGLSAVPVQIIGSTATVTMSNCVFTAGAGAPGMAGAAGAPGANGGNGNSGFQGGVGGSSPIGSSGGPGGPGGFSGGGGSTGGSGGGGAPGGPGGAGSSCSTGSGVAGGFGSPGSPGGPGSSGGGGPTFNADGADGGSVGFPGSGGGGGGGGGSTSTVNLNCTGHPGGRGGGGGGGAAGGSPGTGGKSGGSSVALFAINANVSLPGTTLQSGAGGAGGAGGSGGAGGVRGFGGGPESGTGAAAGGPGGDGGNGGTGGHGGGGAGGWSIPQLNSGAVTTIVAPTRTPGSPGAGGASSGSSGAAGSNPATFAIGFVPLSMSLPGGVAPLSVHGRILCARNTTSFPTAPSVADTDGAEAYTISITGAAVGGSATVVNNAVRFTPTTDYIGWGYVPIRATETLNPSRFVDGFVVVRVGGATESCPADFNHSGARTVQDIFDFLAAWFGGCP